MTGIESAGTLRGKISTARREAFIGRSAEIDLVRAALEAEVPPFPRVRMIIGAAARPAAAIRPDRRTVVPLAPIGR